jgi:hypothetical protein
MNTETRRTKLNELLCKGIAIPYSVHLSIEKDHPSADVYQWGWWAYLWDRPHARTWTRTEWGLDHAQERWDESQKHVTAMRTLEAERHARETEAQREHDRREAARRQHQADTLNAELRRRYLGVPGASDADFEREFPTLLVDHNRREMERLDQQSRQSMQSLIRNNF